MKPLNANELTELLPATPEQLADGLASFELAAPILCRDPGYLRTLVAEGWMETSVVHVSGKPAFLIGWHLTPDGGFWFDLVKTLSAGVHYSVCSNCVEQLARQKRARYIRWVTMRKGIVKWAAESGYEAEAVILTKTL